MLKVAYSDIYKYDLPDGHRFPMIKYELLPEQLIREGTLSESQFFHPDSFSFESLNLTHTSDYLEKLQSLTLSRKEERAIGFPIREDLIVRGRHIAKGTYDCALNALHDGVSLNIAGGTHHAFDDHGEGFCVFNDIAISTKMLLHNQIVKKVLIVDLDVHQGNGTAFIFSKNPNVFTFSIHGEHNYPLRKEKSDLDIGLPDECDDKLYLETLDKHLSRIIDSFKPEFIFYLAGVDILQTDLLGRLNVSRKGCRQRDAYLLNLCKKNGIPVAVSMGGGYSPNLRDIIEAHANTFRVVQEMYF